MNKRGIFFMALAILLISFFLLSLTFYSVVKDRGNVQRRVGTLNGFVAGVEEDLDRRAFISGFRILFLFQTEIIEEGEYIDDVDAGFEELFYNGTLNGVSHLDVMTGATFSDLEETFREKAGKVSANISFSNPSVSVYQYDPWNVGMNLSFDFYVEDLAGLASWNKTLDSVALIPVEGFGDPVYYVGTNSLVFQNITKSPYEDFVNGGDVSNLSAHAIGSYYINTTKAPDFLSRFEGDLTPDENGIESIVNLAELASSGVQVYEKSVIDHEYFSANPVGYCSVSPSGMPSWFRLNVNRVGDYGVVCA